MSLHNLCFVLGLILALGTAAFVPQVNAARAFFVFGDSLVDSGNNNFLLTTARADAYPYGVDYPTRRATGRFSNGYNIPDLISQNLGASESPLPYLNPALGGARLLVGANFASAGVGILNDTGVQFVNIIRMPLQLAYFRQYQQRVSALIGPEQTEQLISNSLTLMTLGGNDFVNNYFLVQNSARSRQYNIQDYVPFIISEYRKILMELYNLGARRVLVTGTGPLGCAPGELSGRSRNGECVAEVQEAAGLFNPQLAQMLQEINSEVGRDVFIAANTQQSHLDFVNNPGAYGFIESKVACCGQGRFNGFGFCTRVSSLCARRDLYAFWDAFHPTERANRLIVQQMMTGSADYMSPMNLSTIMAMDG